jgi:hypothetical protein
MIRSSACVLLLYHWWYNANPGEPRKAEDIVAVQIQHTGSNCVVHTLWRSPNEDDTQYEVLANGMQMSNDTVVVNTSNGTRISALFSIRCAAYEISVRASNVCDRTPATSNFTLMQTPSHSLSELGLVSYRTDPTDGKSRINTVSARSLHSLVVHRYGIYFKSSFVYDIAFYHLNWSLVIFFTGVAIGDTTVEKLTARCGEYNGEKW